MKKILAVSALLAAFCLPFANAQAAQSTAPVKEYINPAGNPVDQFTGKYWLEATPTEKEAFLYGIDTAITIDKYINDLMVTDSAKSGKKPVSVLSPFELGWMDGFRNLTRKDAVEMVDNWYKHNPDKLERPVLDVIWYEIVVPRNAK